MRIRIVCYEDVNRWIIGKFALKMEALLSAWGHQVDIATNVDPSADINHHLIYLGYKYQQAGVQTLMITHVDSHKKLHLVKKQLAVAEMGICMSRETVDMLTNFGIPRAQLSYVNPAQDGIIKPRKLIVGLTCRVQEDGRKREYFFKELANQLDPDDFSFKIMGDGWDEQVALLKEKGFEVQWFDSFIYDEYLKIIPSLDYYLYMGMDEGQMGYADALAAGVKTIVTTQGYHLDAIEGLTYGFKELDELLEIFANISAERKKITGSIKSWNWEDYTRKHVDIWEYLLSKKNITAFVKPERPYLDGINSVAAYDTKVFKRDRLKAVTDYIKLVRSKLKHSYYKKQNKKKMA